MNKRTLAQWAQLAPAAAVPVLLSSLLSAPAMAGTVTLGFEAAPSFASIGNTYASLGVSFGGDALGLANDGTGSGVNGEFFTHAPSPLGVMVAVGSDSAMNVAGGFYALSFYYSSDTAVADAVQVWSELDGHGSVLASFNLGANATTGCSDSAFCNWEMQSASFQGMARSVTFTGGVGVAGFDDITYVPEPGSALLAGLGLASLLVLRRRRA
jgi:hypothetical protein